MKTIFYILSAAILTNFFSCNNSQRKSELAKGDTVTIVHQLGTTEVPKNPKVVVVLDFGVLENLTEIGVKPAAIPKVGLPQYLNQYKDDPSVVDVGNLVEVNLEKINAVKPDLIIIGGRQAASYDQISKIAPTICLQIDYKDFFTGFKENINTLSKIFDDTEALNKALADLNNKIEAVRAKVLAADNKALIVIHNKGRFSAYGSGSRFGVIHDLLGLKEAKSGLSIHQHGNPISSEFIQETNPDILFIVDRSSVVSKDILDKSQIENKLIQQTDAFRNGKIIYLDTEAWYLSGGGGITSFNIMIDEIDQSL